MLREKRGRCHHKEEISKSTEGLRSHVSLAQAERNYYTHSIEQSLSTTYPPSCEQLCPGVRGASSHSSGRVSVFQSEAPCSTLGICNEGLKQLYNYIFDEASTIGEHGKTAHGPNAVISMLHNYLEEHNVPPSLHFHADNCVRQNKNKSVLADFTCRILCGLIDNSTLSFMRVGHTRCAVDGYFGLLKQQY